jgi:hypothetical protein
MFKNKNKNIKKIKNIYFCGLLNLFILMVYKLCKKRKYKLPEDIGHLGLSTPPFYSLPGSW